MNAVAFAGLALFCPFVPFATLDKKSARANLSSRETNQKRKRFGEIRHSRVIYPRPEQSEEHKRGVEILPPIEIQKFLKRKRRPITFFLKETDQYHSGFFHLALPECIGEAVREIDVAWPGFLAKMVGGLNNYGKTDSCRRFEYGASLSPALSLAEQLNEANWLIN
jgi:hypothetical protein